MNYILLKELMKQSETECGFDSKKFAQLIVQECLDIASEVRGEPATDTHYVIGYDRACEKMISGIKEHFGVEE
jgi:hypothetical protein